MAFHSDRLSIAVVGAGRWGPNLIRNFHLHPKCHLAWICDPDAERLNAVGQHYGDVKTTTQWFEAVSDPNVDAVVICTPTSTHFELTQAALNAGKHVLVEKPITTNCQQAEILSSLAEKKHLKLMVGHVFLFNSGIKLVKEIIESGELGDLYYLYTTRTNLGPIRGDVNALWDLAPHDISIALYLLQDLPETVSGYGAAFINRPHEDVAFANLKFNNGVFANIHVSWLDPKKVRQLVIVGSKKMLIFDDNASSDTVRILDKNVSRDLSKSVVNDNIQLFRKSILEGKEKILSVPPSEPLRNECHAFVDWLLYGAPQPSNGTFGVHVVRILERIQASMRDHGREKELRSLEGPALKLKDPEASPDKPLWH